MGEVLTWLALLMVCSACALVTTVAVVRWKMRRRNRVDPATASPAPLHWLISPTEPARLHRRLQTVARTAIVHADLDEDLTAEIVTIAVRLDVQTVATSSGPTDDRRAHRHRLRREVRDLEVATLRLVQPLSGPVEEPAIDALMLLAEAREEVEQLDRAGRVH